MTYSSDAIYTGLLNMTSGKPVRVVALISSFNEEDVIGQVIGDLIENGCDVYLLDNRSTDNTVQVASQWLGKGLLEIEIFPPASVQGEEFDKQYLWTEILRRKTQLAQQLQADWFIHADADELRESPWPGMTLRDAFGVVDALGYNAVNFALYNFRPVNDSFTPGDDLRARFSFYEPGEWVNALQIKAWKNSGQEIDIASSGGHNIGFAQRNVFPIPFILRHYPIRSSAHGIKKVLKERVPRYPKHERAAGWHNHYDAMVADQHQFLWNSEQLTHFDLAQIRNEILGRTFNKLLLVNSSTKTNFGNAADEQWLLRHIGQSLGLSGSITVQEYLSGFEVLRQLLEIFQRDKSAVNCPLPDQLPLIAAIARIECAKADLSGDYRLSFMWNQIETSLNAAKVSRAAQINETPETADSVKASPEIQTEKVVLQPFEGEDLLDYAARLIDAGHLEDAYETLISIQDERGSDAGFLFQLGRIGVTSLMLDDANNIFEEAAKLDPEIVKRIVAFYQTHTPATPFIAPYKAKTDSSAGGLLEIGTQLISSGQYEMAFATLTQALNDTPDNPEVIFQMARLAHICGMNTDAQELFYQSCLRSPEMTGNMLSFFKEQITGQASQ